MTAVHPPASPRAPLRLRADLLRTELALRGINQEQFAEIAGLAPPTVSHAFTGRPISAQTLQKIVVALERLPKTPGAAELVAGAPIAS